MSLMSSGSGGDGFDPNQFRNQQENSHKLEQRRARNQRRLRALPQIPNPEALPREILTMIGQYANMTADEVENELLMGKLQILDQYQQAYEEQEAIDRESVRDISELLGEDRPPLIVEKDSNPKKDDHNKKGPDLGSL